MSAARPSKTRVGILISGRGSNMIRLIEAARAPDYPAEIACVVSNVPDAPGLGRASSQNIPAFAFNHKDFSTRKDFEDEMNRVLAEARVEVLALAGFMRRLTPAFVDKWQGRMLNIHPSLLPAFGGLDTHERALAAGVKIAGCTVHLVTAELDGGPILAQAAVPVMEDDTRDSLAARVLAAEHALYPETLRHFLLSKSAPPAPKQNEFSFHASPKLFWPPLKYD